MLKDNLSTLIIGNIVAFIVAMIAIKTFITFLQKHGFKVFGWYRIVVGLILIILLLMGVDLKVV
jgi:undecaprenyl-diphosphatase